MVVLLVVGVLVLLLTAACIWESRTGRPMWTGAEHGRPRSDLTRATAAAAASVVFLDLGSGGDG